MAGGVDVRSGDARPFPLAEVSDIGAAAVVSTPTGVEAIALKFVGERHGRHWVGNAANERRIVIGLIAADVVVMVQRTSDDGGEVSGTKYGVALMRIGGHVKHHGHIVDADDIFEQATGLVLGECD